MLSGQVGFAQVRAPAEFNIEGAAPRRVFDHLILQRVVRCIITLMVMLPELPMPVLYSHCSVAQFAFRAFFMQRIAKEDVRSWGKFGDGAGQLRPGAVNRQWTGACGAGTNAHLLVMRNAKRNSQNLCISMNNHTNNHPPVMRIAKRKQQF